MVAREGSRLRPDACHARFLPFLMPDRSELEPPAGRCPMPGVRRAGPFGSATIFGFFGQDMASQNPYKGPAGEQFCGGRGAAQSDRFRVRAEQARLAKATSQHPLTLT